MTEKKFKKVTGIGGIFFKCNNPEQMKNWYSHNLGLVTNDYGSVFEFRRTDKPEQKSYAVWSLFDQETEYFEPSEKEFMINYRVADLEELLKELRENDVEIIGEIETYEYGKFAHILDPEGNKIELWEPVDQVFTDLYGDRTTH